MDKVFVKVNEFSFSSRDMYDVNDFLEKKSKLYNYFNCSDFSVYGRRDNS